MDPEHRGNENASVAYIAACPATDANKTYIKEQLKATLAGQPPPDYATGLDLNEKEFKGYEGHSGISGEGKRALGYDL